MIIYEDGSKRDREIALTEFSSMSCPILITTDTAIRGLDIPNVKHVISYEMPPIIEDYLVRLDLVSPNTGLATAFFNKKNEGIAKQMSSLLGKDCPFWLRACFLGAGYRVGQKNSRFESSGVGGCAGKIPFWQTDYQKS